MLSISAFVSLGKARLLGELVSFDLDVREELGTLSHADMPCP